MTSSASLHTLASDIWQTLATFLDCHDVISLLLTGDSLLHHALGPKGGIQSLQLEWIELWPSIALHRFNRLTHLRISNDTSPTALVRGYLEDIDLLQLPKTLRELVLEFPNALSALYLLPAGTSLSDLVPDLVTLKFGPQFIPTSFVGDRFLQSLPRHELMTLELPDRLPFDFEAVEHLPPGLTKLICCLTATTENPPPQEGALKWPPQLTNLHLLDFTQPDLVMHLPRTLLTFRADYIYEQGRSLDINNLGEPEDLKIQKPDWEPRHVLQLPPHLQSLTVVKSTVWTREKVVCLPQSLTELRANIEFSGCARYLPPNLTSLVVPSMQLLYTHASDEHWALLPRSLTSFPNICTLLRAPIAQRLISIRLAELGDAESLLVPDSVTSLYVDSLVTSEVGNARIMKLPLTICHFSFPLRTGPLDNFLQQLPPTITELALRTSQYKYLSWAWPPRLRKLDFYGYVAPSFDDFFASLPSTLTELSGYHDELAYTFNNLSKLPRGLLRLQLQISQSRDKLLLNSHLEGIPPRIQYLMFDYISCTLSAEAILRLPSSLRVLKKNALFSDHPLKPPPLPAHHCPSHQLYIRYSPYLRRNLLIAAWHEETDNALWRAGVLGKLIQVCPNVDFFLDGDLTDEMLEPLQRARCSLVFHSDNTVTVRQTAQ